MKRKKPLLVQIYEPMSVELALRLADKATEATAENNPYAEAAKALAREVRRLRPYEPETGRLRAMLAAHRSLEVLESR
jgi:hypothetical protein